MVLRFFCRFSWALGRFIVLATKRFRLEAKYIKQDKLYSSETPRYRSLLHHYGTMTGPIGQARAHGRCLAQL